MKIKAFIVLLFILFGGVASGQHCPYDFASILVISVHEEDNLNNIANLKITLVDSNKNAVLDHNEKEIVFWQNPEKSSNEYNSPEKARATSFPFAKDNYVWVCDAIFSIEDYYLKIEETGDVQQYLLPKHELIKLYEIDKYRLCGNYRNKDYYSYSGERLYKPIEVIVRKK